MRSPVNWALLGLIIERPSYAYDLAHRFERRYGQALAVSSIGHIYTALGALKERELVEEIPGTREGRQPRPRYRATAHGLAEYGDWLVGQVDDDRNRREVFVLALAALAGDPERLLEVMDRCEQAWLAAGMDTPIERGRRSEEAAAPLRQLVEEDERLVAGARLAWIQYARQELAKLRRG
ncbi:MAG: PadR family transcriptional regulator [Solirubrobacteraceae bacterium]